MSHKSPVPRSGRLKPNPSFFSPSSKGKEPAVSDAILKQARKSGHLNLSNRGLTNVPEKVWRLNIDPPEGANADFDTNDRWWDQVDLRRLNLSANEIEELSEGLGNFIALQCLDVQYNKLSSLPLTLGTLQNLTELLLSHNNLTSLPCEIQNLSNLEVLRLDRNRLTELTPSVTCLRSLEILSVSQNELVSLPPDIGLLSNLRSINVSENQLTSLPDTLGQMKGLQELLLNNNRLVSLPPFDGIRQLKELNVRQNLLKEFPNISNTPLKSLLLGINQISVLPEEQLRNLKTLTILELRENKLTKLPDCIVELNKLERLDLTNNDLSSLPFVMGRMDHLQSFHLDGNPLRTLRREVINRGTAELLRYLLSRIEDEPPQTPPTFGSPAHTSKIKSTPSNQSPSTNSDRRTLDLSKSGLTEFTEDLLGGHTGYTILKLSFNKLRALPGTVGSLTRLTVLDLSNNHLSDLPRTLASCTVLQDVVISNNNFTQLPEVLYQIISLENLLASDNRIGSINVDGLMRLRSLACLDLHNNDIRQVPPQLGNMEWLRHLEIGGNPFRNPRPAIVAKGTTELLQYLRDRIPT